MATALKLNSEDKFRNKSIGIFELSQGTGKAKTDLNSISLTCICRCFHLRKCPRIYKQLLLKMRSFRWHLWHRLFVSATCFLSAF